MSWLRGLKTPERTQRSNRRRRIQGRHSAQVSSEQLETRTLLSAISWDGGGGDLNWNTPENWSGDVLPGSNDDVTINIPGQDATISNVSGTIQSLTSSEEIVIQGGTLDIAASSSIAKLTHVSGTLTGTGNIDVIGDYVWQTGTLSGEATLSVHGGLKLREAGAFNNDWHLYARTLVNLGNGDATGLFGPEFTTARMFFHDGAEFQNAGSFAIETTVGMRFILADATGSRIVNSGNFFNATSDVSTSEGVLFENSGSLSVSSGQLQLAGGFTNAGSCHIDEGTTLLISGLFESESTANITGTGHLYLQYATQRGSVMAGGDVTLDGTTIEGDFGVAGNLRDLGAAFNGSPVLIGGSASIEGDWLGTGEVTINGLMTWNIGAWINGTGTIVANGGMHITGSGISRLTGMTIENAGVAIFDGGLIEGYNGSVIHNLPGATFEIRNDADIYDIGGAAQVRFDNDGTFQKLTGADVASVNFQFNNSGTVEVQSGQLVLNGGGTSTGDFLVGSGATLFASGEFSATSDITGAGDLTLDGTQRGTVNIGGNVTLSGVIEGDFNVGGDLSVPEGNGATFNGTPVTIGGNADVNRMFGTGDVTIAGLFTWNLNGVAQMFGTGRTIANGGMLFAGNGLATLQQRTIVNAGNAVWTGAAIYIANNAQIINTGTFDIQSDGPLNSSSECPVFTNSGQLIKSAGDGTTYLNMLLVNSGSVVVQTGILNIGCGYVPDGGNVVGSVETSEIVNPGSFVVVPSPPITIGNFTQTATGELFEQIGGLIPGTEYGQIAVNGTVNLDGLLHVTLLNGFSPQLGDQFTIINNQGTQPINGTFFGLSEGLVIWSGNYGFTVTYSGGDGNDFVLTMDQFANQAPVFSQANYQFTINSKSLIAATVGTAPAADPDSEDVLTYSIEGGNTQGAFAIDPATGQISVANPAKLPKIVAPNTSVDAPVLTILASDGSLVDTAVVTITLQAAPQAMAPIAAARVVSFNLRENTLAGATAATVSGSPAYTGQSFANWTISDTPGGPASSIFYLKSATATGVVIGVNSMLSYEDASSYTIYVTVSDSLDATRTMTSAVTIHITDVNEAPQLSLTDGVAGVPTVTSGTPIALVAKYTINEYRMSTAVATPENGDLLFTLNAHDDDQSGSSLLYALTGTGVTSPSAGVFIDKSGAFRFDAATGKIIVIDATKLDYEKFRAGVPLVFSVTDNGLPGSRPDATPAVRTSRATVTILLNDLNDAPTFASPTLSVSRPENNPGSAVLFSLRATDGDVYDGVTQSLTYSLVSVLDGLGMDVTSLFTISLTTNPTTGLFTGWVSVIPAKLFDFEVMARNTFIFTVRATEDAAGGLSTADSVVGDQVITMNITDLNEAPTAVFTPAAPGSGSQSSGTTGSVTVNLADMNNGTVIGLFSFSDPDVWAPSLTYGPDSLVVFSVVDSSSSTAPALSYVANADPITGGSLRISNMTTLQSRIGKPFVLRITVKDKQGLTGGLSIRLTLTINVINEVGIL